MYKILALLNDFKAIKNGTIIQRIIRRLIGRIASKIMAKVR